MKLTSSLHNLGQSLWLDNITRGMLNDGTLEVEITGVKHGTIDSRFETR